MILINLLPEELRKKEIVKLSLPELPSKKTIIRVIGAFLGIQILLTFFSVYQHFFVMPGLQKETTALATRLKDITDKKDQIISMNGRLKQIKDATDRKLYMAYLLNTLSGSMTKGVWLTSFSIETPTIAAKKGDKASKKGSKDALPADAAKDSSKAKKEKDGKDSKKKDAAKPKAGNQKGADTAPEAPKKVTNLKLKGTVYAPNQETASIGRFLKELKSNRSFSDYFTDIELGNMSERKIKDYDVYDFEIVCRFKKDYV